MTSLIELNTERFFLRSLTEYDVTQRYLSWLQEVDAKKYITTAAQTEGIIELKKYVCDRVGRDDVLFLGIFERTTGIHIGNIKYEPVSIEFGYAIMGILIGELAYRGKGVTIEVLKASAQWLKDVYYIDEILLGVNAENRAAIRAYEKIGFVAAETPYIKPITPGTITMGWRIGS